MFFKKKNWPGIKKEILQNFYNNLIINYHNTIINFLSFQNINLSYNVNELHKLKNILLSAPNPKSHALKNGLDILCTTDLREEMIFLKTPSLRIYGSLDTLVPKKITTILNHNLPNSYSVIIKNAVHIPFLSHKKQFISTIFNFIKKVTT
ncbi:hypothetical protein [Buchnera aphidicola]|uniref:hypothetical protein n=1 Tax=Buchnera aphidicola TaxID=9 RepID=UPI003BEEECE6